MATCGVRIPSGASADEFHHSEACMRVGSGLFLCKNTHENKSSPMLVDIAQISYVLPNKM